MQAQNKTFQLNHPLKNKGAGDMIMVSNGKSYLKKSAFWISVGEIAINLFFVPAFFIKWFHEIAVLPGYSEITGEFSTSRTDYYYSIADNLGPENLSFLMYLSFAIIVCSVIASVINAVKTESKAATICARALFALSAVFFFVLFVIAASVRRGD